MKRAQINSKEIMNEPSIFQNHMFFAEMRRVSVKKTGSPHRNPGNQETT